MAGRCYDQNKEKVLIHLGPSIRATTVGSLLQTGESGATDHMGREFKDWLKAQHYEQRFSCLVDRSDAAGYGCQTSSLRYGRDEAQGIERRATSYFLDLCYKAQGSERRATPSLIDSRSEVQGFEASSTAPPPMYLLGFLSE
ncbi:unnamed protein product, partial [Prorocentrum cordatum]